MAYDRTVPGATYDTNQRNPAIKLTTHHYYLYFTNITLQHKRKINEKITKIKIKMTQHYSAKYTVYQIIS